MKNLTFIFILLFEVSCGQKINKDLLTGDFESDLRQLLPVGLIELDIMGFQMPDGYNELQEKFKKGIAENQEWYMEYIKTAKSGQGLGYHPNLGLTEEEWEKFSKMTEQMKMVKARTGFIEVLQTDSIIEITGSDDTEGFNGLKINLKTKILSTDYDAWDFTETIQANEYQDKTGMWSGYNWKYQQLDTANLTNLTNFKGKDYDFSIGQLVESKKAIIFFKSREFVDGQQYRMADLLVTYHIPKNKK
ncbi:MAG: hypothetical protein HYY40_01150 [Bacteroidetes bacterium]|nr:hypothetical protein [Bacteroidota bacterium]